MTHDFSRRLAPLLVAGALAGALVGASAQATTVPADDHDTRIVRHALGEVEVPADPQRIIALDELAGLAALGVGVEPMIVYASLGDEATADILRDAGLDVRPSELLALPSNEALLALEPDLIVGVGADAPVGTQHAALSAIAPTAVIDIEGSWRDITLGAAEVFGAVDVGERQVASIEARLAAADEAATDGATLALIGYSTEPFSMPPHSPVSTLIAEAGFTRPQAEQAETESYSLPFSMELLADHDAELIVVPEGAYYPGSTLTDHPLAVELTGTVVHPVAEQWFGNSAFSFWIVAGDLATLAAGDTDVVTADEIGDAWEAFVADTAPAADAPPDATPATSAP